MAFLLSVVLVLFLLVANETWWRKRNPDSELSRKFIHITVGSFVAFWPYLLSWNEIRLLSVGFVAVLALSKFFNIFQAIHSVQRPTWGEFFFALAVGLLSFVQHHPHIYTAALLEMSLADGLAAIVGTRFGKRNSYHVMFALKSVAGTLAFLVVSLTILAGYSHSIHSHSLLLSPMAFAIALVATALENVSPWGADNLIVPLFMGAALLFFP